MLHNAYQVVIVIYAIGKKEYLLNFFLLSISLLLLQ